MNALILHLHSEFCIGYFGASAGSVCRCGGWLRRRCGCRVCWLLLALAQAGCIAAKAVAQVVELCAANLAGALHLDLGNLRRVQRERSLDAFAADQATNGEHLAHAFALAGDDDAGEDLHALFFAFENLLVDFDGVADFELGHVGLEAGRLHVCDQGIFHGVLLHLSRGPVEGRARTAS